MRRPPVSSRISALVKFKKLAGGGYFKIINRAVAGRPAGAGLSRARRSPRSRSMRWATGPMGRRAPGDQPADAEGQGLPPTKYHPTLEGGNEGGGSTSSSFFNKWSIGEGISSSIQLNVPAGKAQRPDPSTCLRISALTKQEIDAAKYPRSAGAMTAKRRHRISRKSITRSSIAPIPAGASASAISRWRAISA